MSHKPGTVDDERHDVNNNLYTDDEQHPSAMSTPLTLADIHIDVSPRRFVVLVVYIAFGIGNQFQYIGNANIVDQLSEYLGCSKFDVNLLAIVFALLYVIGAFPACELFHRIGLRWGLVIGIGVNALGAVLKVVAVTATRSYWVLFTGQVFAGVGQVFFLALPPLLAATWFPTSERSLATALGTLSTFIGMALGFSVPTALVNDSHKSKSDFAALYGAQAAFCVVNFLSVVFVPAHPEHPPSVTSPSYLALVLENSKSAFDDPSQTLLSQKAKAGVIAAADAAEEQEILDRAAPEHVLSQLWGQRRNYSFLCVLCVFGIGAGATTSIGAVLSQMMKPYGVSESAAGNALLVGLLCGAAACVVVAPFLDKYRRYKKPIVCFYVVLVCFISALAVVMRYAPSGEKTFVPITYIAVFVIVVSLLPTLPIGLELAVELTYPLPEAASGTACMWANSLIAGLGTFTVSAIVGSDATRSQGLYVMVGVCVIIALCAVAVIFFVKEDLRRLAAEKGNDSNASVEGSNDMSDERGAGGVDMSMRGV